MSVAADSENPDVVKSDAWLNVDPALPTTLISMGANFIISNMFVYGFTGNAKMAYLAGVLTVPISLFTCVSAAITLDVVFSDFQAQSQGPPIPVPFTSKLTQQLQPGQTLFIHGRINDNANEFQVNLLSGTPTINPSQGAVGLHIDARFSEGKFVFNTLQGGQWGKEERESLVFQKGQEFDLRIRALDDKFEILANHKEIHEYTYRIPLNTIDFLNINGDITLSGVHWGGRYFKLPFNTQFPAGHLNPGDRILLYGMPTGKQFQVNLLGQNGDILFHFNPRFNENAVVRNSSVGGTWGNEEREGGFPFKKDTAFDLIIVNEPYSIQIFIDNERFGTFAHRTSNPAFDYAGITVDGDLELTGLEFSHS
ncbi:hypothetical protein FO519_005424 [Halicephalobus sp. NKZ332]|nr:hypothetical protein FO519_005424 [Halicephalobus sp. NKZ332]